MIAMDTDPTEADTEATRHGEVRQPHRLRLAFKTPNRPASLRDLGAGAESMEAKQGK